MPRFAILEHDWPTRHWDLLLEQGSALKSWRLLTEPQPGHTCPAEPNADHRLLYLDYEGEVSGNRGRVQRWDHGDYTNEPNHELGTTWQIQLHGQRLHCTATLQHATDGTLWFQLIDQQG